jgi:predicted nucleic acid-binding protein
MAVCVLDAAIAVSWCIPSETDDAAAAALDAIVRGGALAPGLWSIEVANALLMAERRQRISEAQRLRALQALVELDIEVDAQEAAVIWGRVSHLAQIHRLTVYDATYLELALRRSLPLATTDKALARAAEATGLGVLV